MGPNVGTTYRLGVRVCWLQGLRPSEAQSVGFEVSGFRLARSQAWGLRLGVRAYGWGLGRRGLGCTMGFKVYCYVVQSSRGNSHS